MDFPWISKGLPSTTQYYDLLKKLAFWIEIMKNVLIRFANRFVWSDERRYAGQTEIWKFWKIWNFWNFFFVELFRTYYDFLQDFENYGHLKKYRLFEKKKKHLECVKDAECFSTLQALDFQSLLIFCLPKLEISDMYGKDRSIQ